MFEISVLCRIYEVTRKDGKRNVDIVHALSVDKDLLDKDLVLLVQIWRLTHIGHECHMNQERYE